MELCNEIWCVIECSDVGEVFEPEFFKSEEEVMNYIRQDAEECRATYSDYPDFDVFFDEEGLCATVGNSEMSWTWRGFQESRKIENLCEE